MYPENSDGVGLRVCGRIFEDKFQYQIEKWVAQCKANVVKHILDVLQHRLLLFPTSRIPLAALLGEVFVYFHAEYRDC